MDRHLSAAQRASVAQATRDGYLTQGGTSAVWRELRDAWRAWCRLIYHPFVVVWELPRFAHVELSMETMDHCGPTWAAARTVRLNDAALTEQSAFIAPFLRTTAAIGSFAFVAQVEQPHAHEIARFFLQQAEAAERASQAAMGAISPEEINA